MSVEATNDSAPNGSEPNDSAAAGEELTGLTAGQPIVFSGNRLVRVSAELAERFQAGDRLIVVSDSGELLHIPASEWTISSAAVTRAVTAFGAMGAVSDDAVSDFYRLFADHLADDNRFGVIAEANRIDIESARDRGRSTTRLELSDKMRADMIDGLRMWQATTSTRDSVAEAVDHGDWRLEQRVAGLGVVGFIFEGRPNVFADACGVLRGGNTVVFRIGSDALGTARAIVDNALDPALEQAGLPPGAASLVDSAAHAAGWAMFSDPRLSLAVARGSGPVVAQLGTVARQAGIAVSLHGTGGAWVVASTSADAERLGAIVASSLDRKVCNTVNTVCVHADRASELVPTVLSGLAAAADARQAAPKVHVAASAAPFVPDGWFDTEVDITRADGAHREAKAETIADGLLGHEWEWEDSPELTIAVVDTVDEAVELFNAQAPGFVASLISTDADEHERFWETVNAPFVGDGFTRWVDGQYAFNRPELGLSNWQFGRLFGRGAVLSGDSVYTLRTRMWQGPDNVKR